MPEIKKKKNYNESEMPLFDRDLNTFDENMNINKTLKTNEITKKSPEKQEEKKGLNNEYNSLTVGSFLQEARVKSDYSLNQVSLITKLNIHYIEAIERNDFSNAPPYIYVRAYVKKLSELYGVDQAKALSLLKPYGEHDKIISETILQELEESKQINEKEEKKIVFLIKIGAIIFTVLLIIFILIYLISGGSKDKTTYSVDASNIKEVKEQVQKKMEKLIVPQTMNPSELKVPGSK